MSIIDFTIPYSKDQLHDIIKSCPVCSRHFRPLSSDKQLHHFNCNCDCFCIRFNLFRINFIVLYFGIKTYDRLTFTNNKIVFASGSSKDTIRTIKNNQISISEITELYHQYKLLY